MKCHSDPYPLIIVGELRSECMLFTSGCGGIRCDDCGGCRYHAGPLGFSNLFEACEGGLFEALPYQRFRIQLAGVQPFLCHGLRLGLCLWGVGGVVGCVG